MPENLLDDLIFDIAWDMVISRIQNRQMAEVDLADEVLKETEDLWDWFLGADNPRLEKEFKEEGELLRDILGYPKPNWM